MRHGVDELPQEVELRTLHQARHHDGEADAHGHAGHADKGLPDAGADMGPCDVEQKFHGDYRLLLMMLRRASLTTELMWAVIAAEITASSGSEGAVVTAGYHGSFGCCAWLIGRFTHGRGFRGSD